MATDDSTVAPADQPRREYIETVTFTRADLEPDIAQLIIAIMGVSESLNESAMYSNDSWEKFNTTSSLALAGKILTQQLYARMGKSSKRRLNPLPRKPKLRIVQDEKGGAA